MKNPLYWLMEFITRIILDGLLVILVKQSFTSLWWSCLLIRNKIVVRSGKHTGLGLFLTREILGITGITIAENGIPGKGARFEITVPKGGTGVRMPGKNNDSRNYPPASGATSSAGTNSGAFSICPAAIS